MMADSRYLGNLTATYFTRTKCSATSLEEMSFNFKSPSQPQGGTGFSFLSPSTTAQASPGGLFAKPVASTAPASTGFSLTTAATSTASPLKPTSQAPTMTPLSFQTPPKTGTGSLALGAGSTNISFNLPGMTSASTTSATSGTATGTAATAPSTTAGGLVPSTAPPLTPATTTATSTSSTLPATLSYTQLEDMLNKWTLELGDQERLFLNQATQINAWDNLLASNCFKLKNLHSTIEKVKQQQKKINYDLDFILAQQKELENCLIILEKENSASVYNSDPQREKMYRMAETIDNQLKKMSEDLKETIEHINETSRSQESPDPIVKISRILNAQMNSLQWINEHISKVQTQLDTSSKTCDNIKRECDKSYMTSFCN